MKNTGDQANRSLTAATPDFPTVETRRIAALIRSLRPRQWTKNLIVFFGLIFGEQLRNPEAVTRATLAFAIFCALSGVVYLINDIRDREADRLHPRKRNRPVASGEVPVPTAAAWAGVLTILAAASIALALVGVPSSLPALWLGACVGVYVLNTTAYSLGLKHILILDVISLAAGFVLRVIGGCAAAGVAPSPWLLNCTFFVAMFLAFGKRLGERRSMGPRAAGTRAVHEFYTDDLLRMAVVVTAVGSLLTYAEYTQAQAARYTLGFNLLWLTVLPATYAMFRCIVLLESGKYDDPTELASRDRPFQAAALIFAAIVVALVLGLHPGTRG